MSIPVSPAHAALAPEVRELFDAMVAAGGRIVDGRWHPTHSTVTTNCLGSRERGKPPHHHPCEGWISPLTVVWKCACPCHDDNRPTHAEAAERVRSAVAQADARRARRAALSRA